MKVFHGFEQARGQLDGCAVALGNFDGVHRGHQALFAQARKSAKTGPAIAATFDPHPGKILHPDLAPKLLTPLWRRLELMAACGLDAVVVQPFDRAYASATAEQFVERDLFGALKPSTVVVGPDFTYGKARGGNVQTLAQACQARDASFISVPPVTFDGVVVSSTKIREFVAEGRVGAAAALLGRPFELMGVVERGEGRGRTIGFPTANLHPEPEVRPGIGVYAVRAFHAGRVYDGAANIGRKPTFGEAELTVEIHLFGFSGDLYGEKLSVEFIERLRGEQRFGSPGELVAQIERDCQHARAILATAPQPGALSPGAALSPIV